tara:strand:+ start:165 stop:713 length:549 start_codon:yes stop_codon:yes gene_type:complete
MIQFYKANPKVTGTACSFSVNPKDKSVFASLIKQKSWDDKSKTGRFDADSKCTIKLNLMELGAIINAIETKSDWSAYHGTQTRATKMNFSPYSQGDNHGFNFRVTADSKEDSENKATYSMGFRYGEAEALKQYFIFSMHSIYQTSLEESQASFRDSKKNAPSKGQSTTSTPTKDTEDEDVVW